MLPTLSKKAMHAITMLKIILLIMCNSQSHEALGMYYELYKPFMVIILFNLHSQSRTKELLPL